MGSRSQCWCGVRDLRPFGEGYLDCAACGTLVRVEERESEAIPGGGPDCDFYGRVYWFDRQKDLGKPDLSQRATADLTGRALYWLRTVLAYKPAPARVLEIGAAHGGFVALLRWAGYDAIGLELSPWVADFARRSFAVPMLEGLLEAQDLETDLDLIVALDVLEHLPDPAGTLGHCARLLADDGMLLVQTPCRGERSLGEMRDAGDRFVEMLLPEHLYLFRRDGVEELCRRAGLCEVRFLPALFPYDMFFVAGRLPPERLAEATVRQCLLDRPASRLILALLDLGARASEVERDYHQADADRVGRQQQIDELRGLLEAEKRARSEDREAHEATIRALAGSGRCPRPEAAEGELTWEFPPRRSPASGEEAPDGPIAVDLTALLPEGENGGAKWVATTLVRWWASLAPDRDFLLLTSGPCHRELAGLEGPNVRRRLTTPDANGFSEVLDEEPVRLLFCPMTAPPFFDPRVPLVCLVHDLQHLAFPQFFDPDERAERDRAFRRLARLADRVVTVSEYVRGTVLEHGAALGYSLDAFRVTAIPNGASDRLSRSPETGHGDVLRRLGLERDGYLLYPANFWAHKNHLLLLTAFGQYRRRVGRRSGLKLVLTGAERPDPGRVREATRRMGLDDAVLLPGFLPDAELAALVDGCRALVFPSLHEGFGMPVVEAMSRGRPVLCSDTTGLPEVAGDAALLFDPRRPAEIAEAMERITRDADLAADLSRRGKARAAELGGARRMARSYLRLLDETLSAPRRLPDSLAGVWPDGWTRGRFTVGLAEPGTLELGLSNPRDESVVISAGTGGKVESVAVPPGGELLLRCRIDESGCLELATRPTLCSAAQGLDADVRYRGLRLESCVLRRPSGDLDLLVADDG